MVQAETPTRMRRFKRQGRHVTHGTPQKVISFARLHFAIRFSEGEYPLAEWLVYTNAIKDWC